MSDEAIWAQGNVDISHLIKGARDTQFEIVMKSPQSQVVLAALTPGESSMRQPSINRRSDQVVYTIEGEGLVKIGSSGHRIQAGTLLLIPAGQPHQVTNTGARRLLFLNFFAPPMY